jgi:hypothetical protein
MSVEGRVALDLEAAGGGFTRVLLRAGASRVYPVAVGSGQLLGSPVLRDALLQLGPDVMRPPTSQSGGSSRIV